MNVILDFSSLIFLAGAGLLQLLAHNFDPARDPYCVRAEAVDAGLSRGHPDAVAIEATIVGMQAQ